MYPFMSLLIHQPYIEYLFCIRHKLSHGDIDMHNTHSIPSRSSRATSTCVASFTRHVLTHSLYMNDAQYVLSHYRGRSTQDEVTARSPKLSPFTYALLHLFNKYSFSAYPAPTYYRLQESGGDKVSALQELRVCG